MANIVWRRKSRKVYVYYYDRNVRGIRQIRREDTEHLDGRPPEEAYAWVRQWEKDHGVEREAIQRVSLAPTDKARILWDAYQKNRGKLRKRRPSTERAENDAFELYIVPFFIQEHERKDPTTWHDLIPEFHTHLFDIGLSEALLKKILWALERFGKYLVFQRRMAFPFTVQIPARDNHKETPLKVKLTPKNVLDFVKTNHFAGRNVHWRLAILLGYFASLRPSELYALRREDFLTGDEAVQHSKTYEGLRGGGLGSRLAVRICKTLVGGGVEELVKSHHSFGVITIWHPEAALMIASLLRDVSTPYLFQTPRPGSPRPFSRGYLDGAWRRWVTPSLGSTAHDLRRASGLYLGRTARIPLTLLQEHMRHAEIETTMLYCREPGVRELKLSGKQDFDDVV